MPVGTSPPAARPMTHLEGLNHLLQAGIMVVRHISRVNLWSWVLVEIPLKIVHGVNLHWARVYIKILNPEPLFNKNPGS